ncbi:MAG: aromatic-ring-hydroxylating dioxygenase subunit beta [Nitrospinae bacterium]|nr:aromatic-ring-hydroxylating dioxygenase subunit beta [Nitrospinota bacterium]
MSPVALRHEFEDLLYYEVWLLDHDRLEEWLALCAEQVRYWAPIRTNVARGSEEWSRQYMLAHFDEDKGSLALRVQRIRTGAAHADEPPARVRHLVSNVRVLGGNDEVATVTSNFIVFKSRRGREESLFVGCREDRWRRIDGTWRLEERLIVLDHDVIENITVLF